MTDRRIARAGRRPAARRQHGFTLIELLIVLAIIGLLASISMATFRSARVRGSEAAAIGALHAITQAQFAFSQACGNQRYAPTLASLLTPMPSTGHGFLSPDLASDPVVKSGYQIVMSATPITDPGLTCIGVAGVDGYQLTADPLKPGLSGSRFFAANTDRVVYEDLVTFVGNMPETGSPGHGTEVK